MLLIHQYRVIRHNQSAASVGQHQGLQATYPDLSFRVSPERFLNCSTPLCLWRLLQPHILFYAIKSSVFHNVIYQVEALFFNGLAVSQLLMQRFCKPHTNGLYNSTFIPLGVVSPCICLHCHDTEIYSDLFIDGCLVNLQSTIAVLSINITVISHRSQAIISLNVDLWRE